MKQTLESLVERDKDHDCSGTDPKKVCVRVVAVADLPTLFGNFKIVAFLNSRDQHEHIAIVHGHIVGVENIPTRLHSECLTGDALGSLRCDCRDQLQSALSVLASSPGPGLLLYLRQEGRGIGLSNKIRAYGLQDKGMDTVDANLALGFKDDERDYAVAAHMIKSLGVKSIQLITNNPHKIEDLQVHGVHVNGRISHIIPPNSHNRFYLETKAKRFGHWIDFAGKPHMAEQSEPILVDGMPREDKP
jgi:GTP cyclohydrolase II